MRCSTLLRRVASGGSFQKSFRRTRLCRGIFTRGRTLYPWLRHIFADGAYAGVKLKHALSELGTWTFEIIKRSDTAKGFEALPRRWVVERTFAWLNRCRRLAKDFEATITAPLPGSSSPISAALPDGSQGLESNQLFMSQTLRFDSRVWRNKP